MSGPDVVVIALTGVTATGHHGVFDHERRDGQTFVVDAVLTVRRPVPTGDVATTVDYGAVAAAIVADVESDPVALIETLAARLANRLCGFDLVEEVRVTVHKPSAPIAVPFGDVAVTVTRKAAR